MGKYFAGEVVSKSELVELDEGKTAINLIIATELENSILDIKETVNQRVVLFNAEATAVDKAINEGDCIVISDGTRNARTYVTDKKTKVATVDIVARRFVKMTKAALTKAMPKIKELMFTLEDLTFQDSDAEVVDATKPII